MHGQQIIKKKLKGDSVSARYNYVRQPSLYKKPSGELDTNTYHRTKVQTATGHYFSETHKRA